MTKSFAGIVHTIAHEFEHVRRLKEGIVSAATHEFLGEAIEILSENMPEEDLETLAPGAVGYVAGFTSDARRGLDNWNNMPLADRQRFRAVHRCSRCRAQSHRRRYACATGPACRTGGSVQRRSGATGAMSKRVCVWISSLLIMGVFIGLPACSEQQDKKATTVDTEIQDAIPMTEQDMNQERPLVVGIRINGAEAQRSRPIPVEVQIHNQSDSPLLMNKRMAPGYADSQDRELYAVIYRQDTDKEVS